MKITVELGSRSYPVHINDGSDLPEVLLKTFPKRKFALVTNTVLSGIYADLLDSWKRRLDFIQIEINDGERYKNLDTWRIMLDSLLNSGLDRSAVVIAFGGGVIGDMAGFAAACFLRGVDYVQVPTTLLAMVDSSVGGKTGIDHSSGKNRIGAFHQPRMVWIDTTYLDTLPAREFMAGYGEVFKYAFIGGREMFSFIEQNHNKIINREAGPLLMAIENSIRIKASVVSDDEHEKSGRRALLNFGHTFAHALESFYNFEQVLHGEAVLWGIACAVELGKISGIIAESSWPEYQNIIKLLPCIKLPSMPSVEKLCGLMMSDKKNLGGRLHFVLPSVPGQSVICDSIKDDQLSLSISSVIQSAVRI